MTIPLETFRSAFIFSFCLIIATFLNGPLFRLPFNSDYLLIPFLLLWLYAMTAALTNLKEKSMKFYWKKKDKILFVPFQHGGRLLAYDNDGNTYKLGLFFTPKLLK